MQRIIVAQRDRLRVGELCRICATVFPEAEVGVCRNAGMTLDSLAGEAADLVLAGLEFPDADGMETMERIRLRTRFLLLVSSRKDDWTMLTLRTARFDGFFDPEEDDPDTLAKVLPGIIAGHAYYSRNVRDRLLAPKLASVLTEKLTVTELKVFKVISDGSTDTEAAQVLGISARTVETHRQSIRSKLGVSSSAKLVWEAVRLGVSPPARTGMACAPVVAKPA